MTNLSRTLLGGTIAFSCVVALQPACLAELPGEEVQLSHEYFINKAIVVGEDARLENFVDVRDATATVPLPAADNEEPHCNYTASAPHLGDKTFRFEDGNKVVFSSERKSRIQFITVDGSIRQIEEGKNTYRKKWWCRNDGVILFSAALAPDGNLSGVKVDWFDSRGMRRTETQVNIAPYEKTISWSYMSSRLIDDCLGLTFLVQKGKSIGSQKSAKFVEYKLCPKGI